MYMNIVKDSQWKKIIAKGHSELEAMSFRFDFLGKNTFPKGHSILTDHPKFSSVNLSIKLRMLPSIKINCLERKILQTNTEHVYWKGTGTVKFDFKTRC